ncbi:Uncharacterised protein [Bordetella pertussis]|nr:Uncharacterised protein [Bordetella pertussis]CPH85595.1 Uncharacterised protein [Bordetella pertussis]
MTRVHRARGVAALDVHQHYGSQRGYTQKTAGQKAQRVQTVSHMGKRAQIRGTARLKGLGVTHDYCSIE